MSTVSESQWRIQTFAPSTANYRLLRISCWVVALGLGAAQSWAKRFEMDPDGVSYLDIGDAYWRGDWHNAVNAYWSPLYSWVLGFFLKLCRPSAYWEYPTVRLANFLIYLAALVCFEFFLTTFITQRRQRSLQLLNDGQMGLPESAWWLLGYSLFLCSSLLLIGADLVTPDMCVAAFVYLASALVLKIRAGSTGHRTFVALGLVLGFAYLAKAVMFPLGLVFLGTAIFASRPWPNWLRNAAIATLAFVAVAGPFIAAISYAKGRTTFGDSGRLNFTWCINGVDPWYPGDGGRIICIGTGRVQDIDGQSVALAGSLRHPVKKIFDTPAAYWFDEPITGTYPFWYDPSYWQDGVKGHFDGSTQLWTIGRSFLIYLDLLKTVYLNVLAPFLILLLISSAPIRFWARAVERWEVIVPSATAFILYSLVHTEPRYVAGFIAIVGLIAFHGLRFRESPELRRFLTLTLLAVAVTTLGFTGRIVVSDAIAARGLAPVYWLVAKSLNDHGVQPGARIATVTPEPFGAGGAFVGRLARLQIIAQVNQPDRFWASPASTQSAVLEAFRRAGCDGVLGWKVPRSASGWQRLGPTEYWFLKLDDRPKLP